MDDALLKPEHILNGLRPHPRLIVDGKRLAAIRNLVSSDEFAAAALSAARRDAAAMHGLPHTVPSKGDLRFTEQSLGIIHSCTLVWWLERDAASLACARDRLVAISSAPAWERENFLAIGELAYVLALGYDWLRNDLAVADRELVRRAIVALLTQAEAAYEEGDWWIDAAINWNHECNGGIITAALAVADSDPDLARSLLPRAVRWLDHALDGYEPDGGWDEGAGYWYRATAYTVYALSALDSALGTDFGLSSRHGFAETARFLLSSIGPTGRVACYADCTPDRDVRTEIPVLLWLAKRYDRPEYARSELTHAQRHTATAAHLLWYEPIGTPPPLALDQHFRAPGSFVSMRSSWDDSHALFAWIKGGNNQVNHGHLDQGNFEIDALGQRWARDLGSDSYALPGYFDRQPGGRRWDWYRLGSLSHSVPLIDGTNQQPAGIVRITGFHPDPASPRAVLDLSEAYKPAAGLARRGIMLVERRAVLIQDEFTLAKPCRFTWAMTTDAKIIIAGTTATLSLGGQLLTATILEPAGAVFSQESAERAPPEAANIGVRRLLIDLSGVHGRLRVVVLLSPHWPDGAQPAPPAILPLGRWF